MCQKLAPAGTRLSRLQLLANDNDADLQMAGFDDSLIMTKLTLT